jgi:hypothetical protein
MRHMNGGCLDLAPWRVARRVFGGQGLDERPTYWLSWARSVVGMATVAAISLPYRSSADVLVEIAERTVLVTAGAFAVFVLVAPAVYGVAERATRRVMRAGLPGVLVCLAVIVASVGAVSATVSYRLWNSAAAEALGGLPWMLAVTWFGLFAVSAVVHGARSVLRIGDVHVLLAPLCAAAGSAVLCVVEVVRFDTGGLPDDQWLVLNLGGFGLTAAIALLELRLLWIDGARLLRPHEPYALTPDEKRRRRRVAAWVALPLLGLGGAGAVVLVHRALGGGSFTLFVVLAAATLLGRLLWRSGGERVRELLR